MIKLKINKHTDLHKWKECQAKDMVFKNKGDHLMNMDYPESYPCILCYDWMSYVMEDAYNGFLNYGYVYSEDFE
jgi:hypothetical protein